MNLCICRAGEDVQAVQRHRKGGDGFEVGAGRGYKTATGKLLLEISISVFKA